MGIKIISRAVAALATAAVLTVAAAGPARADETPPTLADPQGVEAAVGGTFDGPAVDLDSKQNGVRVPSDSGRALALSTSHWTKSVKVGLPGREADAAVSGGSAVFEDVAVDASLVVQPVDVSSTPELDSAVRTLITVESTDAPTRYEFPLDLPVGTSAQQLPDGSVAVVDRTGGVVGAFAAPWAVDASGAAVPTRFTLEGDVLVQTIDHTGAAHPVVADPFWFVPAVIVGVRLIAPIVIKAATKKAAMKAAAKAAAKVAAKQGKRVKSLGGATKAKFYTARGAIKVGVKTKAKGHTSFASFKAKYGTRKGYDWHHIVEQKHLKTGRFGAKYIHNPNNVVQVPTKIHQKCVNSIMGRKSLVVPKLRPAPGKTLRQTIDAMDSFVDMHKAGVRILRYCGVKI